MEDVFVASAPRFIVVAILGVGLLLWLIIKLKLHALLALLISGIFIGLGVGLPVPSLLEAVKTGISSTLGSIALLVGLGTMFGGILTKTGAVDTLANTMVRKFGDERAIIAIGLTGLLIGIPVFYDAAFVILFPLAVTMARKANKPVMSFVMAMVGGIGVGQIIPPPLRRLSLGAFWGSTLALSP